MERHLTEMLRNPQPKEPVHRGKSRRRGRRRRRKGEKSRVSDEAIRIRAYLISERRERLGIPGDANSDWIEARRQLLAEREKADSFRGRSFCSS